MRCSSWIYIVCGRAVGRKYQYGRLLHQVCDMLNSEDMILIAGILIAAEELLYAVVVTGVTSQPQYSSQ